MAMRLLHTHQVYRLERPRKGRISRRLLRRLLRWSLVRGQARPRS
jgi:hypothetical protein